jgi:ectoine hydroxylase-related dioxygenase (phytanoyl-CoA dioxygenase family)
VLACVHHLFGRRFFLASFEGREPCPGGGQQNLHRDCLKPAGPTHNVSLLAFLDPFGAENGATRLVPGSHTNDEPLSGSDPREIVIGGEAGDALLFHSHLIHSGRRNDSGAPRRTLIASYQGYEQYATRFFKLEAPGGGDAVRYVIGEEA